MQIDQELDTRGLNCPLPILKAKKALAELTSGQICGWCPPTPALCATLRPLPSKPAMNWSSKAPKGKTLFTSCAAGDAAANAVGGAATFLKLQRLEVAPKALTHFMVLQGQFNSGL